MALIDAAYRSESAGEAVDIDEPLQNGRQRTRLLGSVVAGA